ncbi:MAG: hypothetical protein LBR62_01550, partial [Puniceicoccales bacterium]|nr:hypothetical protein [Puniceicoccales bacterium]
DDDDESEDGATEINTATQKGDGILKLQLTGGTESDAIAAEALRKSDDETSNPVKNFTATKGDVEETFTIQLMDSPAPYGYGKFFYGFGNHTDIGEKKVGWDGTWHNEGEVTASVVSQSWAAGLQQKVQDIETETQKINNDVTALRSKIDTFDSTSSTMRKRASDTYLHAIGNIH